MRCGKRWRVKGLQRCATGSSGGGVNSEWWLVDREVKSPTRKPDVLGTQVPLKTLRLSHPPSASNTARAFTHPLRCHGEANKELSVPVGYCQDQMIGQGNVLARYCEIILNRVEGRKFPGCLLVVVSKQG